MSDNISYRDIQFQVDHTGVTVIITTDIPCHIKIRTTQMLPRIHSKPVLRRGMWLNDDVRFCFDVYHDEEQDEPGDTLIHTFHKPDWDLDNQYHIYPWGHVLGQLSPSTGPILSYTCPSTWPPPPVPVRYAWSRIFSTTGTRRDIDAGYKCAPTFQVTDTPTDSDEFLLYTRNNDNVTVLVSLSLVDPTGKPLDSMLAWTTINLMAGVLIQNTPPEQVVYRHTATIPYVYTPSTVYALVMETINGQAQWWNRFRTYGWEGDKDSGQANHIDYYATHPLYPTWTRVSPYRTCYEGWGFQ